MKNKEKSNKPVKSKNGRELTLTEGIKKDMLLLVRQGKDMKQISEALNVNYQNILNWRYNHITSDWNNAQMLYQLDQAEAFSDKLMKLEAGKKDTSLLAIQQKEVEFLRKQLLVAKSKYNDTPQVAIQVNLPSPIIDLGKLDSN